MRPLPIIPNGTVINGCEVIAAGDNNTYTMKCGRCEKLFYPKRARVARRTVRSCGCYQRQLHGFICTQAFHNYGRKPQE